MEALIICAAVFFVMGVAVGALFKGWRSQGGGTITVDGYTYYLNRARLAEIARLLTPDGEYLITGIANGRLPATEENLRRAAQAWEDAARQWLQSHPEEAAQLRGER